MTNDQPEYLQELYASLKKFNEAMLSGEIRAFMQSNLSMKQNDEFLVLVKEAMKNHLYKIGEEMVSSLKLLKDGK